jgi:hypothetical protein
MANKQYLPLGQYSSKKKFWSLMVWLFIALNMLTAGHQSRSFSLSGVKLDLEPNTELEHITTAELMGSNAAARYAIAVNDPFGFQQGVTTKLSRRLPNLWKIAIPNDFDLPSLQVDYTLLSATGKWDSLSGVEDSLSEIQVQLFPTPPEVIQTTRDFKVVQGGVIIQLEVSEVYLSGNYQGTLNVSIYGL